MLCGYGISSEICLSPEAHLDPDIFLQVILGKNSHALSDFMQTVVGEQQNLLQTLNQIEVWPLTGPFRYLILNHVLKGEAAAQAKVSGKLEQTFFQKCLVFGFISFPVPADDLHGMLPPSCFTVRLVLSGRWTVLGFHHVQAGLGFQAAVVL